MSHVALDVMKFRTSPAFTALRYSIVPQINSEFDATNNSLAGAEAVDLLTQHQPFGCTLTYITQLLKLEGTVRDVAVLASSVAVYISTGILGA